MALVPLDPPDDGRTIWLIHAEDGRSFAVVATDDGPRVSDALCPHRGGPLEQGWLRQGRLVCPWHWFRYDLDTGACLTDARLTLRTYPVVERDGTAYADVGTKEPELSWAEKLRAHARGDDPP